MSTTRQGVEEEIYAAAERLHAQVGADFTMEQLEATARISRATIYRRVGGKAAVLRHIATDHGVDAEPDRDTRTRILKATRRVFSARGLRAATIEQIAAEGGVGAATVYRHFGSKERLARAFMEEMTPRTLIHEAVLHPTQDVEADLQRIVEALLRAFSEHRDLLRWAYLGDESDHAYVHALRGPADSTFGRVTAYFQRQLQAGRLRSDAQADELALTLLGAIIGAAIIGPLHYHRALDDPKRISQGIVEVLLNDLRGG